MPEVIVTLKMEPKMIFSPFAGENPDLVNLLNKKVEKEAAN